MTEWTITTLKEHIEALRAADARALELQAAEYERRLDDLNHAHARAQERNASYVTLDKFESQTQSDRTAQKLEREQQDLRLGSLENWKSKATGASVVLTIVAGSVGAAIAKVFGS